LIVIFINKAKTLDSMDDYRPPIFVAGGTIGPKQQIEIDDRGSKEHKFFIPVDGERAGIGTLEQVIHSKKTGDIISWTSSIEEKELTPADNSFHAKTNMDGIIRSSLEIPPDCGKKVFIRPEIEVDGDLIGNFVLAYLTYFSKKYGFEIPKLNSIKDITQIEAAAAIARRKIPQDKQAVPLLLGDSYFLRADELDFLVDGLYGKADFAYYFVNKEVFDAFTKKLGAGKFSDEEYRKHKMTFWGMKSERNPVGLYRLGNLSVVNPLKVDREFLDIIKFIVSNRHIHHEGHESLYSRVSGKIGKFNNIRRLRKEYISRHPDSRAKINSVVFGLANIFYSSLFHYHSLDRSLHNRFPSFEDFSKDITDAISVGGRNFKVLLLPLELEDSPAGKLYGPGILYDLDTRRTVDFTKTFAHSYK